ncbi:MAG: ABC transporter substrate-binding protein [Phycisphaerales bacterium]|nr:ABC transporter substrate-binding protein [Phycisphaerales bacterium]
MWRVRCVSFVNVVALAIVMVVIAACEQKTPAGNAGAGWNQSATGAPADQGNAASPRSAEEMRIVVLSPALAITLRDLGLADKIVGRHGYDMVLEKSVPVCGDQSGIDYEALIGVRPTHVILQWGARDLPGRLVELAGQHGWVVVNQEMLTLADIRTSAVELDDMLIGPDRQRTEEKPPKRVPDAEGQASDVIRKMNRAFSRRGTGFSDVGRVLMLVSTSPASGIGPGSFHQQVLEVIGGEPAIMEGGPYREMDTEDVIRLAPDAIVLLMPRAAGSADVERTEADIEKLLGPLAGKPIPAVVKGRVAVIDDPLCLMPATSLAGFADELAEVLGGWQGEKK